MLEACSFKEFWAISRTDFAKLKIAGFEDNMRKYVKVLYLIIPYQIVI